MTLEARARAWIGTPFVQGASRQGQGCDCLGLIGGLLDLDLPRYSARWQQELGPQALQRALETRFAQARGPRASGEIWLFALRARGPGVHLGLSTQEGSHFIHAYCGAGVVESPLSAPWARRLIGRFWPQEKEQ